MHFHDHGVDIIELMLVFITKYPQLLHLSVSHINITVNQIVKVVDSHIKFAEDIYNSIHFATYRQAIVPYTGINAKKIIYPLLSHLPSLAFS